MPVIKTLRSAALWTIGGLYFGGFLVTLIVLSYLFPPRKYDPFIKKGLRGLFRLLGIPVTVKGQEHLDPRKTYLFMANHVSIFDIPLLGGYIPHFVRGVEADRQFRWPLYGYVVRRVGNIPISRENVHASIRSIHQAAERLKAGQSMVILPEGHRTLDGNLRSFKKLPFYLAKKAGCEIVPVGMSGLFSLKRKGSWHIHPGPVMIRFGKPIDRETVERLSVTELRDLTRKAIEELIEWH
ncbi:MAG: 1-acyl-sn-glycerol-3-phosphate acyltransferase [Calditrichaeota bacterium]|nr:1-acyl-sn-glycerol-3-phosphate acyltransferase [Calditrichota bacterium]